MGGGAFSSAALFLAACSRYEAPLSSFFARLIWVSGRCFLIGGGSTGGLGDQWETLEQCQIFRRFSGIADTPIPLSLHDTPSLRFTQVPIARQVKLPAQIAGMESNLFHPHCESESTAGQTGGT